MAYEPYRDSLLTQGYVILKGLYTPEEIATAREEVAAYLLNNPALDNANGKFLPDFVGIPELARTTALKDAPALREILDACFSDQPWRFCGHSDVAVNRVVSGWHKDILNGAYTKYMKRSPWSPGPAGESYGILKVGIYLQDHSADASALQVVPGSHLRSDLGTAGAIRLRPALGDAVIFDQRITHRGMERQTPGSRVMISFGFGLENCFTDWFEEGTRARQRDQLAALTPKVAE
jgi:hypothetical protein